jgi:copper homeostasis protein CutC
MECNGSLYLGKSCIIQNSNIKQVVGKQVTQIITQAMTEYVADGRSMTAEAKLAYRVVMMTGSGLKSAQRRRLVTSCKLTAMHPRGGG